ncbi:hypothetical protein, partial [Pacificibacter sp.]|uniref:hypothetical protein n=1 Tax=Pacificibacter sp. TaxID=1917866 RepID=UPI00321A1CA4
TELHAIILISLLAATASVVSQGKFFTYHYLPFLLPLPITIALTADAMIEQVNRDARSVLKKTGAIMVVVAMLILPYQTAFTKSLRNVIIEVNDGDDKLHWALHNMPPDFNFIETVAAAEEIAELQKPDDQIFVWGYETLLYFLLQRPPSYRYPYAWPLVVDFYDGRYTHDLISRLEAKPPETFIVQFDDQTPHVTGHNHDSRDMLKKIPELLHFLDQNYSKVKTVPRFEIWRRNF